MAGWPKESFTRKIFNVQFEVVGMQPLSYLLCTSSSKYTILISSLCKMPHMCVNVYVGIEEGLDFLSGL